MKNMQNPIIIDFNRNKDSYAKQLGFNNFNELEDSSEQLLNDGLSIWYVTELIDGKGAAWCYDGNIPSEAWIFNTIEEAKQYQYESMEEQGFNYET